MVEILINILLITLLSLDSILLLSIIPLIFKRYRRWYNKQESNVMYLLLLIWLIYFPLMAIIGTITPLWIGVYIILTVFGIGASLSQIIKV